MNTLTTIEKLERRDSGSWVATLLGGKPAGTTDPVVGAQLDAAWERDPENCLVEVELETRGTRLWITKCEYIEPPEELGGPESPETTRSAQEESPSTDETSAPAPGLTVEQRLDRIEEFLNNTHGAEFYA